MILMSFRALFVFVVVTAVAGLAAACHRKTDAAMVATPTIETPAQTKEDAQLTEAVNAYAAEQNAENDAAVRKAMADADSEIAVLEELVAKRHGREREKVATKLRRLEARRSEETTRFAAVQAKTSLAPGVLEGPSGSGKADGVPR
jgi:hypothetical protein